MKESESSTVAVDFASEVDQEQREAAERSIGTLQQRAEGLSAVRRAADEALAGILPPRPDRERVEVAADAPAAIAVREALEREQRAFLAASVFEGLSPAGDGGFQIGGEDLGLASRVFALPFHFDWSFHTGAALFSNISDRSTGRIEISAMAMSHCEAHAGVGVSVFADQGRQATARALRRSSEKGRVFSGATGAVALAEGGMDLAVLENGRLLAHSPVRDQRYRLRVNPSFLGNSEQDDYDSGGFGVGEPIEVTWTMEKDHTYQINLGGWVKVDFVEGSNAAGPIAGASGSIVAEALAITVFYH